jgi:hypothetical protein
MPVNVHAGVKPNGAYEFNRRHPRILFSIPITVRHLCQGGVQSTRGMSLDLGEGGLGAIVQGEVRVGETVAIDFRLSDQPLTTVAIARHSSQVRSGFEFIGLKPEERLRIGKLVGRS